MADSFSRDTLVAYEKQPQTQVADTQEHLMAGATPAKAATAEDMAAAGKASNDTVTDPPSGGDGDPADQSVTGDGTSDENAESSTASADGSGETETATEEDKPKDEEASNGKPAPKKGSAAERVQEVLDLMDGYKEFGKHVQKQLQEAQAEIARLKAGSGTPAATKTETAPPAEEKDEPMPDISDSDVNFDVDKLRVKTAKWVKDQIKRGVDSGVKAAVDGVTGKTEAQKIQAEVVAKTTKFAASHPDWKAVVDENPVLVANQLAPDAALAVAQSEYTAELLYHFGQDPGLAIRIAKQTPAQQLLTVGKLIAKFEAAKSVTTETDNSSKENKGAPASGAKPGQKKSLTQAPPPPSPTRASGRRDERDVTDPGISMDEFARRHREVKQAHRVESRKARGLA